MQPIYVYIEVFFV